MSTKLECAYCRTTFRGMTRQFERKLHIVTEHPEAAGRSNAEHGAAARAIWREKMDSIIGLSGDRCLACGMTAAKARQAGRGGLTIDHVVPLTRGGADDLTNWQPLCRSCNGIKGDAVIDYRPSAIVAGIIAAQLDAMADAKVLPNTIIVVTDPGSCVLRRIGRMGWCSAHDLPMGHAIREAVTAREAILEARRKAADDSRRRRRLLGIA